MAGGQGTRQGEREQRWGADSVNAPVKWARALQGHWTGRLIKHRALDTRLLRFSQPKRSGCPPPQVWSSFLNRTRQRAGTVKRGDGTFIPPVNGYSSRGHYGFWERCSSFAMGGLI